MRFQYEDKWSPEKAAAAAVIALLAGFLILLVENSAEKKEKGEKKYVYNGFSAGFSTLC